MAQLSAEFFEVSFDRYLYVIAAVMGDVCILFNEPLSRDADMLLTICDYESGMAMDILPKGLFIWTRSTGLARFPRSRLATLFLVKISMCSYERPGWPGYQDLGFCDRGPPYMNPVTGLARLPIRILWCVHMGNFSPVDLDEFKKHNKNGAT